MTPEPNRKKGKHLEKLLNTDKTKRIRKRILIAAVAVLAVLIALIIAYNALFHRPDPDKRNEPPAPTETGGSELNITAMQPKVSGERKSDDFYTFLIMGRDTGGGGNTDTMMLVSYNVTDQQLSVMSLPRDTMVNVPWDIKKLNTVYNFYGGGDKGIAAVKQEVSELVGFVPDYEVIIEWEAVGRLVEAIGGVYFDVPFDMEYEDFVQNLYIDLKAGYQKLNGEQAMGLIRWRHNNDYTVQYPNGDLGRIETQQVFLKAVLEQTLQVKNVGKIMEFSEIFSENVTTDLTVQELFWLGKAAITGGLKMDNVNFVTMPNKGASAWSRSVRNYQSYVVPRANELLELINSSFNPFVKDVSLGEVDFMSVRSDGTLASTSGRVADTKATTKPVEANNRPETKPPEAPELPTESEAPVETQPTEGGTPIETGAVTPPENTPAAE